MRCTDHTFRRGAATVAATALLLSATAVAAAHTAFAEVPPMAGLSVQAPAAVGLAGQPVQFTETITNTGPAAEKVGLYIDAETPVGTPENALSLDYQDQADGAWKPFPLTAVRTSSGGVSFSGDLPGHVTLPVGGVKKLQLRIGAPMGTPHNGDTNGGLDAITLQSNVGALDGSWVALAKDTHTIRVESISSSLAKVPATAVAGGTPIEFDAVLSNPTPSDYVNLGNVLFADRHATVEVRGADGSWTKLTPVPGETAADPSGFYLDGRNSAAKAGSTTTRRVRVSFAGNTTAGKTRLAPCVFVNEGETPFRGTTMCSQATEVTVVAAEPSPSPTSPLPTSPSTPTTATPTPAQVSALDTTTPARLAETGSKHTTTMAVIGGTLLAAGGGVLLLLRRRRSA